MENSSPPAPAASNRCWRTSWPRSERRDVSPVDGGVAFGGDLALCYAANLESRVASRVLWQVGHARYRNEQDLFEAARALPWPKLFDVRRSIRVNVSAIRSPVKSLDFVTLRVKDAVCDAFRATRGQRPDVDTQSPDVRIHVFLTRDEATFYLDTSGEPLFKRGWRTAGGDAPLRENLAAGILKLTGWSAPTPLYDPMCGGGTFLVEAAMMALDAAPGLNRAFGFEKLENFDEKKWGALRDRARARRKPAQPLPIHGSDKSGNILALARENILAAGVSAAVQLKQMDVLDGGPPAEAGILVMNPPYGERLADADARNHRTFSRLWCAAVVSCAEFGRIEFLERPGMSSSYNAAAVIASAWVGWVSEELISAPLE